MQLDFPLHPKQLKAFLTEATEVFYGGATRGGKMGAVDSEIITPFGVRRFGDLKIGSQVSNPDGSVARVIAIYPHGKKDLYRVTFDDGSSTEVGLDHLWQVREARVRRFRKKKKELAATHWRVTTTENLIKEIRKKNILIPLTEPVVFTRTSRSKNPFPIPPYALGAFLGDGHIGESISLCSADDEIITHIAELGIVPIRISEKKGNSAKSYFYDSKLKASFVKLGLEKARCNNKFIPEVYKLSSIESRMELLRGLMDTDGYVDSRGHASYTTISKQLALDVQWISRSLGYKVNITSKIPTYLHLGKKKIGQLAYTVWIKGSTGDLFYLPRKKDRGHSLFCGRDDMTRGRKIISIEFSRNTEAMCITVDHPNGLYITNDFIVTHNSHLMRVVFITFCTWIPGLQAFLFRKVYDDVIQNHMEGPSGFRAMLAPLVQEGHVRITENQVRWTKTGSLITLDHLGSDDVLDKHQGVPKHLLGIEEVCQIPERRIRFLRAWVTMPEDMKAALPDRLQGMFPRILYTGNPIGVSAPYFRRNFVKAATPGTIFKAPDDDGGFLRQYIEARVEDNPSEDAAAVRRRVLGLGNDAESRALLESDWDAPIGEFFTMYREDKHVTPSLKPPAHWFKFRTFDWGSAEPACCLWWCVSDGVSFRDSLGRERWFPAGALIAYREWYVCNERAPSKGLELSNEEMADGIRERTEEPDCVLTVTDSKPFQGVGMKKGGTKYTPADIFREHGVPLQLGNCARVHGWSQLRDRLIGVDGFPMLYLAEDCYYTRDYLPAIGHHKTRPEDAEESGEATHASDCCRLAATTRPVVQKAPDVRPARQRGESISPIDIIVTLQKGNGDGRHGQQFKRY